MNKVRQYRKRAGLSGNKLAQKARISASDLSKVERGKLFPYPAWRQRIAEALEKPEALLFPGEVAHHG